MQGIFKMPCIYIESQYFIQPVIRTTNSTLRLLEVRPPRCQKSDKKQSSKTSKLQL